MAPESGLPSASPGAAGRALNRIASEISTFLVPPDARRFIQGAAGAGQRPVKCGGRFSAKARWPSR